jgi:hypothetical protein
MKLKRAYLSVFSLLFVALLSGCSHKVPNQSYDVKANATLKKISIVKPPVLEELQVFYYNHPGTNFGLIGGLAAAAEFKSKTSSYNAAIKDKAFNISDYFVSQLQKNFEKTNYSVTVLESAPQKEMAYCKSFEACESDAYLDCYIPSIGYIASSGHTVYKPTVIVNARLVKKDTNDVLYEKQLVSGENSYMAEDAEYLDFDATHTYDSFSDLEDNATKSLEGFKIAIDTIAAKIVDSLGNKKQK